MKIGCVKEIKNNENRVGLIPSHVQEYIKHGHNVYVEKGAGEGSGFEDSEYEKYGAILVDNPADIWNKVDMVIKVKEPLEAEYKYFRENLILYTYLHLADNPVLAKALVDSKMCAIGYETVEDINGRLPLLKPMSQIAGILSIQQGTKYLEKTFGGKGILLSGVTGVSGGKIVILGAGEVGINALITAMGTGAHVTIIDKNIERLSYIDQLYGHKVNTVYSDEGNIIEEIKNADVIVGSVLIPGDKAPKLIRREHFKYMEPGTVLVDVAIDQGGCFETSHPTSHDDPIFIVDGMVHYCVANMPGAVPQSATKALSNATLPYGLKIASLGLEGLSSLESHEYKGINTLNGIIVNEAVNKAIGG